MYLLLMRCIPILTIFKWLYGGEGLASAIRRYVFVVNEVYSYARVGAPR